MEKMAEQQVFPIGGEGADGGESNVSPPLTKILKGE